MSVSLVYIFVFSLDYTLYLSSCGRLTAPGDGYMSKVGFGFWILDFGFSDWDWDGTYDYVVFPFLFVSLHFPFFPPFWHSDDFFGGTGLEQKVARAKRLG